MKYKGIELRQGKDSEAELLVAVEITKDFTQERIIEIIERIQAAFAYFDEDVYIETVMDNLINVRCDEITFDIPGVVLLCRMYWTVSELKMEDVKVGVAVHVDGEWFRDGNGHEYNEDVVSLDEFLDHAEYSFPEKEGIFIGMPDVDDYTSIFANP